MSIIHYKPQPIYLPEDSELSRVFCDPRSHLSGRPLLESSDYADYETHVIFNDIYLASDGRFIGGVGPPLVNLKKHLLPISLLVETASGKHQLKHQLKNYNRVTFHRFNLPKALQGASEIKVKLRFANGFTVDRFLVRQSLNPVRLQFTTLQKNNPIAWIVDWIRYCKHMGVERILLYDNASDNAEELRIGLQPVSQSIELVLIDWPFPYGPVRSHYNRFCQSTQNNHVHQCFGQAQWTGHFDIDEYLVNEGDARLVDLLDTTTARSGLLRFDSHWIPRLDLDSPQSPPTVRDFGYRERAARGKAHKYIIRASAYRMANTHNGKVRLGYWRSAISPDDWVFLHYKPLTNNWRGFADRGEVEVFTPELYVEENRLKQFFSEHPGIISDDYSNDSNDSIKRSLRSSNKL